MWEENTLFPHIYDCIQLEPQSPEHPQLLAHISHVVFFNCSMALPYFWLIADKFVNLKFIIVIFE